MNTAAISESRYCLWPPEVTRTNDLGYIEDSKRAGFYGFHPLYLIYSNIISRVNTISSLEHQLTSSVSKTNKRYYPRDIGCSSYVSGCAVYQFGDTFVHDNSEKFVGVTCANASIVKDISKPQQSSY